MRVLVVEDEERLAQNVAAILRDNALCAVDM
jgi:DNA-binding response OmpR family regulator